MTGVQTACQGMKVLMTVDAVGGVWRYAMDLAAGLRILGVETAFVCFGSAPSAAQAAEAQQIGALHVCDLPLDWMVDNEAALHGVPGAIEHYAAVERADLIHLNLPSQAARLRTNIPVVAVGHSCVCTWFKAVRDDHAPKNWQWHFELNRQGFDRADAVVMPSESHARLSTEVYGEIKGLRVVHNGTWLPEVSGPKENYVFAAGRWWDDGKNGAALDAAAGGLDWPVVMAGSNRGPNRQFLQLLNVDHRGELDHSETMALMRQAAIVVSPSLYEPFGLAVLEAARSASAMVLADIPTYRELWSGTALFADPNSKEAFAAAISRLVHDKELRKRLGGLAQARSRAFTVEAQAASVRAIYRHVLSIVQAPTAMEYT